MCGIAGLLAPGTGKLDLRPADILEEMGHRGPDSMGLLSFPVAGGGSPARMPSERIAGAPLEKGVLHLFFRRLSIIDLAEEASQPMSLPDGRHHIIFNGEIYNYLELRRELEALGHQFQTRSDTEVLLHAVKEWGPRCLERLTGMFAFAVLDSVEKKLFLARDPFGIKPLYCTLLNSRFAFASEIKTLLRLSEGERRADAGRLYDYLRFGHTDHGRGTLFSGVHQLPPAHFLMVDLKEPGRAVPERYWAPRYRGDSKLSFADAASRLRELFLESVKLHLRSDVPVGMALSGGVDSSSIAAAIGKLNAGKARLHAFSYYADDPAISEAQWIEIAAKEAGVAIHRVEPKPDSVVEELRALIRAQDEPVSTSSVYAQFCVFRRAHEEGIKVMLDGQGADELFGGYHYFLAVKLAALVRRGKLGEALRFLGEAAQLPGTGYRSLLMGSADRLLPYGLRSKLRQLVGKDLMPAWLDGEWLARQGAILPQSPGPGSLGAALVQGLAEDSLPHLLRYEDRNSMAFSVESRVPFMTTALAEFVYSLPEDYLISKEGTTKAVFRAAMRGLVPDAILDRKDKIGFWTPERRWLTQVSPWVDELLESPAARSIPVIRIDEVKRNWAAIRAGQAGFDARVWRWINLIEWTQMMKVEYAT